MTDTLQELALDEITRALGAQQQTLETVRSRATTLVSVSAVVLGLLGGVLTGKKVDSASWVAFAAFVVIVISAVIILRPQFFIFRNKIEDLINEVDADPDADIASVQRDWALWGSSNYTTNQEKIDHLMIWYQVSLGVLAVEVAALIIHLSR